MSNSLVSLPSVILVTVVASLWVGHAAAQEVALTPMEATDVARGYRADALKINPVINDNNETIGRINDFIFGKDGSIYVVPAVGGERTLSASMLPISVIIIEIRQGAGSSSIFNMRMSDSPPTVAAPPGYLPP
jgi:hypothetical protein